MNPWTAFITGLFLGSLFGIMAASLAAAARTGDSRLGDWPDWDSEHPEDGQ